jgi:NAD+ diphosphatase
VAVTNTFAGVRLDRAGARRTDECWLARARDNRSARRTVIGPDGPWIDGDRPALVLGSGDGTVRRADGFSEDVLLGVDADGTPVFAIAADRGGTNLRDAVAHLSADDAALLAYATAMVTWHRNHGHCARCGHETQMAEAGFVRKCPNCGATHHPRTDPVVIMLVHDDANDRVLLGRQARWPKGRFSALAGFVEPGESLEEAVAREVAEEAGVEVTGLSYRSSQPWPFPASLMIGFHAAYAGGEPRTADAELEDLRWFTRKELAAVVAGQTEFDVPPPAAIARRLIDEWLEAAS